MHTDSAHPVTKANNLQVTEDYDVGHERFDLLFLAELYTQVHRRSFQQHNELSSPSKHKVCLGLPSLPYRRKNSE